jgi:hypothetical protein
MRCVYAGQGRGIALPELCVQHRGSLVLLTCGSSRDGGGGHSSRFEMSSHEEGENGRCA